MKRVPEWSLALLLAIMPVMIAQAETTKPNILVIWEDDIG
jgi:hypothetical protein